MISSRLLAGAFLVVTTSLMLGTAAPTYQCCDQLAKTIPGEVFGRNTTTWTFENKNFWSATEILYPSCVFLPESADKVGLAVSLFAENECKFSIKGGGHSAIPGAANINDGILMVMSKINSVDINIEDETVRVGAGALMGDIYQTLDPHNLTAMIGRYEKVGLGLGIGAGMSYLVNREGLAVNNVRSYEVVLADGSIVDANSTSHPDLWVALQGGNNNFGVITAFTLNTVKTEGAIYGGIVYYPESSLDRVSAQIYDYHIRQASDDGLTHVLPQYGYNGTTNETISFCPVVYSADVQELPDIMAGWIEIPHTSSTLRNRQYYDLSVELNDGFPDGLVQEQRVFTAYADEQLYKDVWTEYNKWLLNYRHISGFYGLHVNMPITSRAVAAGNAKSHAPLGLETSGNETLGVLYFGVTFDSMADAPEVLPAHDEFVKSMEALAADRGLLHPYIMLTYSGYNQAAIASYGPENVAKLLDVAAIYDPTKVFQRLVPGGQKLPNRGN